MSHTVSFYPEKTTVSSIMTDVTGNSTMSGEWFQYLISRNTYADCPVTLSQGLAKDTDAMFCASLSSVYS